MTCGYSRDVLALYVEGDLSGQSTLEVTGHLMSCTECDRFCGQLQKSQALLKSLRRTVADAGALAGVRRGVLSQLDRVQETLPWTIRLERFLMLGFRRWKYAAACVVVMGVLTALTVSVDGHRQPIQTIERPEGYRGWVSIGSPGASKNVYIAPDAYRTFSETGKFPEGTILILEDAVALQVSVKDSSFTGGWGYFEFTGKERSRTADQGNCRTCHEARGETDHVFTQFYPALKVRRG